MFFQTPPTEDFYHAAVVEYLPVSGGDAEETLLMNVQRYVKIIAEAAKQVTFIYIYIYNK